MTFDKATVAHLQNTTVNDMRDPCERGMNEVLWHTVSFRIMGLIFIMMRVGETDDLLEARIYNADSAFQTKVVSEFGRPLLFLFFGAPLDKMTQSHVHVRIQSAITPSNQQRAVLKPCGEQSELFPSSISHSHVKGGGMLSAEELSSF